MTDKHAYRASDELAAALYERLGEIDAFNDTVVRPFDEAHPDHPSLWSRTLSVDVRCVGFKDGTEEVPPGLSRAKTRDELVPRKTKAGQPWRDAMEAFQARPSLGAVLHEFSLPELLLDGGRACTPGCMRTDDGTFMTYGKALDPVPEHLTPVPLSEYYAARERAEQKRTGQGNAA